MKLLLEYGDDANARRSDGSPAVVVAAMRLDLSSVQALLEAGAEVDATDAAGRTALMHAVERGSEDVIAALLCAGADPDRSDSGGATARGLAKVWDRAAVINMLGQSAIPHHVPEPPRTIVERRPEAYALTGTETQLRKLGALVEYVVNQLSAEDFSLRVGFPTEDALTLSRRLDESDADRSAASTRSVGLGAGDMQLLRWTLMELAYGLRGEMPLGMSRIEVVDLYEDFARGA